MGDVVVVGDSVDRKTQPRWCSQFDWEDLSGDFLFDWGGLFDWFGLTGGRGGASMSLRKHHHMVIRVG